MTSTQSTPTASNEVNEIIAAFRKEMTSRIVGQEEMIDGLLTALIAGGHILLEGMPGLAKTLAVKTLAAATGLAFKRIQFTPDLLPADLTGTMVWDPSSGGFSMRRGPLFAQVILADEINRAPAKVQSALLEAMEERQITVGEETYPLPDPFFVLATQNPIEHEGTYPLPEAELDRFLGKYRVRYPQPEEELAVVLRSGPQAPLSPVLSGDVLRMLRQAAEKVRVDEELARYMVALVAATRPGFLKTPPEGEKPGKTASVIRAPGRAAAGPSLAELHRYIAFGASPRATLALFRGCRVRALFEGRPFVIPDDVKALVPAVLRHRLVLSYEAEAEGIDAEALIPRLLTLVPVP